MDKNSILEIISSYAPNNKKITNTTYASRIFLILKYCNIEKVEETIKFIEQNYSQKTFKSFLTSLVVFTKATNNDKLSLEYGKKMKEVNDIIQEKEKTHIPTKEEKLNMVTRNEIKGIIDDLYSMISNMQPKEEYYIYFDTYQKYLVLNLYYLIPPIRNDYVNCKILDEEITNMNSETNYIFLNTKKLVLNRYKTSKSYGEGLEIELPEELVLIIKQWLSIRVIIYPQLQDNKELLLNKNLEPMSQVSLTQYLNKIFKKNVSSTILRKSYLSEKYPVTITTLEMEKDAKSMQHSISTQQKTYRKKI